MAQLWLVGHVETRCMLSDTCTGKRDGSEPPVNSTSFVAMVDLDGAAMQACSVLQQCTVSFSFGDL